MKCVQYDQYPIVDYNLGVKAPEDRYETKMYKRLQESEREVKEVRFHSNIDSLNGNI